MADQAGDAADSAANESAGDNGAVQQTNGTQNGEVGVMVFSIFSIRDRCACGNSFG